MTLLCQALSVLLFLVGAIFFVKWLQQKKKRDVLSGIIEEYKKFFESSYDWELWLEPDNKVKFSSPSCKRITGYNPEEFVKNKNLLESIIHPEDKEIFRQHFSKSTMSCFDFRIVTKEGERRWLEHVCCPIWDDQGQICGRRISNRDVTARKQAEMDLANSERRFKGLADLLPQAIFEMDLEGKFTFVNRKSFEIFGLSAADLGNGVYAYETVVPDEQATAQERIQRMLAGEELKEREYMALAKDGRTFPARIYTNQIREEVSGSIIGLRGTIVDLTEQKKSEEALHLAQYCMDSSLNAFALADLSGNLTYVNRACLEMWGMDTAEEMVGKPAYTFWKSPESAKTVMQILHAKGFWTGELIGSKKDGSTFVARTLAHFVKNKNGKPLCLMGVFVDISAQKQAERNLRQSEKLHRTILENISDAVFLTDKNGFFNFICPNVSCLFGYSVEETWQFKKISLLLGRDFYDPQELEARNEIQNIEIEIRNKFGQPRWLLVTAKQVNFEEVNILFVCRDITETKKLQNEKIRTGQMAILGELAAGVAHEINNPINGIINFSQILINHLPISSQDVKIAHRIMAGAERISKIVEDLLCFARKPAFEKEWVPIENILSSCLNLFDTMFKKEGIKVETRIQDKNFKILVNRKQIEQVFLNLLSNSRHALNVRFPELNPDKKIEIDVTNIISSALPSIQITTQDYGAGIAKENLPLVFDPFFTTKPLGIGTGLGLSICNEIIKAHGGRMEIESKEGQFTCVTIRLPQEPDYLTGATQ